MTHPAASRQTRIHAPLLSLSGITKDYGAVRALKGVSFSIDAGEVVGLIGENGAGKSTLMKVLGGVIEPNSGSITIEGREHAALTVQQSLGAGIAFVHQELNLFDNLDVAANVFIGREPRRGGPLQLVDNRALYARVKPLLQRLGCDFAAHTPVAELSIAQCQMLEIVKALSLDAKLIIMDEPTSSLTTAETNRLLDVVQALKQSGVAIIFITHRLSEIERCADRVIGLRDGSMVGTLARHEIGRDAMIKLMIGRSLKTLYNPPAAPPGRAVLELEAFATRTWRASEVTLGLRGGEILGMAGLIGAGRTELARAIFGIDAPERGTLRLDGTPVAIRAPSDAIARGIFLVPEDRKHAGLVLDDSIARNVSLASLNAISRGGLVDVKAEHRIADEQRRALRIKTPDVDTPAASLSGGNQQKVVLGKWLCMQPRVVIFDEPTRGVDAGAKSEIYALMRELADRGVAILMISSDMEEVIGVSDRVAVMHEGAIKGILDRDSLSEASIMHLAIGNVLH
ncbi:sugar ABC transporter ATP-binding protein [Paraburkholderia silvatlantica]|uniref:sugar ABC transporter ATP-binding protein n=1 Tax=Paraburkholderia silvatlantica TaxID=321895 RepID=UPI00374FE357